MACPGGNSVGHSMGNSMGNALGHWGTHPGAHSDGLQGERDQGGMGLGLAAGDSLTARDSLATAIAELVQRQGGAPESLIEVLHQVQQLQGYLGRQALHQVARELQLPLSRVYGVASFYHLFQRRAPALQRISVCRGTACFVNGAPRLLAALAAHLGVAGEGHRSGDWELQGSGCLGACGAVPVLRLNEGPALRVPLGDGEELTARLAALGIPEFQARDQPRLKA
ncbi:MAG: NAD(P)H-dependent oxidoreductase subunit E [Cyanobium sp. ELA507]